MAVATRGQEFVLPLSSLASRGSSPLPEVSPLHAGRIGRTQRVLHLTPLLFGDAGVFGGAERYSYELARHMAHQTPTTLVAFGDAPKQYTTPDDLRVQLLGPAWWVRGQQFNRFHPGLLRTVLAADIVHCHQPRMLSSELAAMMARFSRKRVFASDLGGGGWGFNSYVGTDRWFHRHLHISQYSQTLAGHTPERSAVIYGGVDTTLFSPDPSVPKEPLVVFVGRLMPHKGVNDLVDALPAGLHLELIGQPYHDQFVQDLKLRAAGKYVTVRHNCTDDDIVHAYRRAMCVVLPSVYRDCYGNETRVPELLGQTLLEGMACGTPAICTDVASMPEVVVDGETGFVVPPNDPLQLRQKLEYLRDNPSAVATMGEAARRRVVQQFSWSSVVQKCLAAYGASPQPSS